MTSIFFGFLSGMIFLGLLHEIQDEEYGKARTSCVVLALTVCMIIINY